MSLIWRLGVFMYKYVGKYVRVFESLALDEEMNDVIL